MSLLFKTLINSGKLKLLTKIWGICLSPCKCIYVRKFSDAARKFVTFDEIVSQRRAEARRSVVVQVNSETSFSELYGYCSQYAKINGIHHYKNSGGEHFMLIEFSTEDNLKEVIRNCSSFYKDPDVVPVSSPFLWFSAVSSKKGKNIIPKTGLTESLVTKDGTDEIDEDILFELLVKCTSVSEQIQLLYDKTRLNDLGVRLRYIVARQLEMIFESLYANVAVWPFGSTVNGFGNMNCDLDLVVTNIVTDDMCGGGEGGRRLVFQSPRVAGGGRLAARHLELLGAALELRAPGAARAVRVLHARVPILKYHHRLADLHCDLAYHSLSGCHMSMLLYSLGSVCAAAGPLVMTVRRWARAAGVTSPLPGHWLTHFPLTALAVFLLQQPPAALPPLQHLAHMARKEDVRIAEDNMNCTFLRDMNQLPLDCYGHNTDNLETLLMKFFEFYAQFDFDEKAISIYEGKAIRKPNSQPLYIVNPLDRTLNVSKNVSFEQLEKFKLEVRKAAWHLESASESGKSDDWGIIGLMDRKDYRGLKKLVRVGNSHRLVSVKDLFNDTGEHMFTESVSSKLARLSRRNEKEIERNVKDMKDKLGKEKNVQQKQGSLKFKNSQIASEVYRIRRDKIQ